MEDISCDLAASKISIMSSLDPKDIASIRFLQRQAASILLYQNVLSEEPGQAFIELLQAIRYSNNNEEIALACIRAYGRWFKAMAVGNESWQDYLISQILKDDNPFTRQAQTPGGWKISPALIAAVENDLQALHSLYKCRGQELSRLVQDATGLPVAPVIWHLRPITVKTIYEKSLRDKLHKLKKWTDAIEDLLVYYKKVGTGLFANYKALRWQSGKLIGVKNSDPVKLTQLVGYEYQRSQLLKNTEFLLAGYPALHVLLYGSRGSGKSSLVKALLNEYSDRHLRLIELAKSDLRDLPTIVEELRDVPQKFIIFVDDLSFEEDDDAFKALKVVLEGSLTARPQNVVVYATSNRRHLIREFFDDRPRPRDGDEVHAWDTVQEKLSFSDRFGLTLTFESADQKTYLEIVNHLAKQAEIYLSEGELEKRALQWATHHNGRSGRTARQFVDFLKGDLAIASQ